MASYLRKSVFEPGLAILFCLAFGGLFVFFGLQTIRLDLARRDGVVKGTLVREHFWGLYSKTRPVEDVVGTRMESHQTTTGRAGHRRRITVSNVVLDCAVGEVPVFWGSSNMEGRQKHEVLETVAGFLGDAATPSLHLVVPVGNVLGWVGVPFLLLGLAGLVGWPFTLVRKWGERMRGAM
jgi:hypothetical protein